MPIVPPYSEVIWSRFAAAMYLPGGVHRDRTGDSMGTPLWAWVRHSRNVSNNPTHKQTNKQTNTSINKQTNKQTNKHTPPPPLQAGGGPAKPDLPLEAAGLPGYFPSRS